MRTRTEPLERGFANVLWFLINKCPLQMYYLILWRLKFIIDLHPIILVIDINEDDYRADT